MESSVSCWWAIHAVRSPVYAENANRIAAFQPFVPVDLLEEWPQDRQASQEICGIS